MKRKNKKGFTLVEIIICIALIGLIGTISIVTINVKNNEKLEEITNKIIEAANVYINVEKDEKGNTYSYGINNGAKGVQVSVKTLEEKGYISEDMVKTLEKESGKTEDLYVFVSNSIKDSSSQECSGSEPQSYTVSWEDTDEPIYLCPYTETSSAGKVFNDENAIYNKIVSQDYESECSPNEIYTAFCYINGENYVDDNVGVYYYKGNVTNNYLKIEGINKIFRIVRTTENNSIKIVEDETITSSITFRHIDNIGLKCFPMTPEDTSSIKVADSFSSYRYGTGNFLVKDSPYYNSDWEDLNFSYICMENFNEISSIYILTRGRLNYTSHAESFSFELTDKSYNGWSDSSLKEITLNMDDFSRKILEDDQVISIQSPIYRNYFQPLNNNYENIKDVMNAYIDTNYKWCTTYSEEHYFKCGTEKKLISNFGLLTFSEYKMVASAKQNNSLDYFYGHSLSNSSVDQTSELTMDLDRTFRIGTYGGCRGCGNDEQYFRPTYVIKGNSKVISGDGTESNPYVISGLTS